MTISYLTKIGFGRESSWGGTVTPSFLLPVAPPSFTVAYEQLLDQDMRGAPVLDYAAYQGVTHVEGSFEGNVYPEEFGYLLYGIMGSAGVSGTAAPYSHTFRVGSYPPSFSFQDENAIQTYRYGGCMVSELSLTFNAAEGLLRYSTSVVGKSKTDPGAGTIDAEATTSPFRGWHVSAIVGSGTAAFGKIIEGELTLSREVNLVWVDGDTQDPGTAVAGPLECTGRVTLLFDSNDDYNRYLNKDQEQFRLTWGYGSGTAEKEMVFTATNMDFGDGAAEIDRSGPNLTLAYTMRALYNTTDVGNCQFTMKNAEDSYVA